MCPALQGALADLGLTPHQLHRIDTQLVTELLPANLKQGAVTFKVTGLLSFVIIAWVQKIPECSMAMSV